MSFVLAAIAFAGLAGTQEPGQLVTAEWLGDRLRDTAVVVVQVEGEQDRFDAAHIPGARFLEAGSIYVPGQREVGVELPSVDSLERVFRSLGIDNDSRIVIASHSILSAARLWMTLDYLGHGDRASLLDGGIARWQAAGLPVETGTPDAAIDTGSFAARGRPAMLVDADWILARLDDPSIVLIDARPDDEYTGADGGMGGMAHPGHIPGASQMYYVNLLQSRDSPLLRPRTQLRSLFEEAGAADGRTIVAYCMVGLRASLTYFTARMLGYDVRFYDGSWHDWGTLDLPYRSGRDPGH